MIRNEFYGKIVRPNIGGADVELIVVEYPVEGKPEAVRAIDRSGARYHLRLDQVKGKGTGQRATHEDITKIAAAAVGRWNKNAGGSPP